ncbi:transposase [Streptomyces sp. PSKA54]|uniref:Transposase n=1 Tax=Streptomyces himalayensis subsp. aureolus TaxID=2758039 RepID=A0A7W2D3K2_9ACTN|nr:transposase [Streptomyces himalayensis]MBA4863830.1 transposase [Streptomyces himalayensis subsp. aureolus]
MGGRKRHLVVDCLGLVLAVAVSAASVQDRGAAQPLLERLRTMYFSIRLVWADGSLRPDRVAPQHHLLSGAPGRRVLPRPGRLGPASPAFRRRCQGRPVPRGRPAYPYESVRVH